MNLYLIRHAQAELIEAGQLDAGRKLTPKGLEQAKTLRRTFEHLDVHLDVVYSSPWRRARQTAAALGSVAHHLEIMPELAAAPDQRLIKKLMALVVQCPEAALALIGHQPWIGELTSLLLTGDTSLAARLEYKKCAVYALEVADGQCLLRFALPSGVLKRLS
jgi:phosphohistidine phosphatase